MARARRSSASITLVLIGTALASSCSRTEVPARDVYSKLENCRADWNNETECEPVRDGRYPGGYFYGPRYFPPIGSGGRITRSPNADDVAELPRSASGSTSSSSTTRSRPSSGGGSVSRGGFGSSASSHGASS